MTGHRLLSPCLFTLLLLTSIACSSILIDAVSGADVPITVLGTVVDLDGGPVIGANVTTTVFDAVGGVRAIRYSMTDDRGVYQTMPEVDPQNWDIGNKVEVVATYQSDYGSNHTWFTEEDKQIGLCKVDVTYPLKSGVPDPHSPVIEDAYASTLEPATGQNVTFHATVTDPDGDLCNVTFYFGDGTNMSVLQNTANSTVITDHAYATTGFKEAFVVARDGQTSPVASEHMILNVSLGPFTRTLATGWNLVSLPLVDYGYKASMLGLNPGDTVSRWNSTTRTYSNYIVGVPVNDFYILPSVGYWINVPAGTRTLTIHGVVPDTVQSVPINVPDGGGWTMIGLVGLNSTRHASDIAGMYDGGSITTVSKYNPATKSYVSWLSAIPTINNFALAPGQGYWVLCSSSGTLTYDP